MEERRQHGFHVRPSFGQVLGFIQEGEPLNLDLPNRKATSFTSSHWWLDDYPNAPEPVSEAPMPHTQLNPAAAFETADEGYDGVPFPRPPREFTRPSFLPDSDDGGMDPGQALRNDGLNPPRPPTLGGRLRESGIQAAETIIAGGAAGAAAAARSVGENGTFNILNRGGDWLDRTLRIPRRPPGLGPPPDEVPPPQIIGRPSEVEPLLERAGQRAAEVERAAAQDIEAFASQQVAEAEASEGFATAAEAAAAGAEAATAAEAGTGALALLGEGALAAAGTVGAAAGGLAVAGAGAALVGTAWALEGGQRRLAHDGLGSRHGRRHGLGRLAGQPRDGCADPERDAGIGGGGPLPGAGAAAAAARAGLQDRHGVRQRRAETPATHRGSEATQTAGPHALRPQQRSHPGLFRQRPLPRQPAVPLGSRTPRHSAVVRPVEERTRTCVVVKGHAERHRSGARRARQEPRLQAWEQQCELHSESKRRSVLPKLAEQLHAHHLQSGSYPPDLRNRFHRSREHQNRLPRAQQLGHPGPEPRHAGAKLFRQARAALRKWPAL